MCPVQRLPGLCPTLPQVRVCSSPPTPSEGTFIIVNGIFSGEYASAIETLVTAISLIKQSKVSNDDRCKILISSLQDTLRGIETKSYGSSRRDRSRSRERERHRRRRERSRSRDREYRDRSRDRDRERLAPDQVKQQKKYFYSSFF